MSARDGIEVEQSVLGALLQDAGALAAAGPLHARDFNDARHGEVFGAIAAMAQEGVPADPIMVFERLQRAGQAERCGGLPYLLSLEQCVQSSRNVGKHAQLLRQRRAKRDALAELDRARAAVDSSADLGEALQLTREVLGGLIDGTHARTPVIPVEWASALPAELHAPPQIVEGALTAGGMSMFYGESNSGKSYLAIRLAICVSLGEPWLGRRTQQGAVLYIAAEGAWSIRLRLAADRKHYGREMGAFGLIPSALSLIDPSADVDALIALILEQRVKLGQPIALIVVDTVARVMGGGDENTAQDMGRLVLAADRIREATGAHLLYIHHAGKDASRGARGHSSLRAALDTEVEVTADEATKTHTAKFTKQRDLASKGDSVAGRFVPVELGVDQWGGRVTACAVVDAEVDAGAGRARRMTPTMRAVMGYLAGQKAGVRKADLVAALIPQGIGRPSAYRAVNDMLAAGLITDTMGLLYVPKE